MSFATRFAWLFAPLMAVLCAPAQAWDYDIGSSLLCDTQAQVERFAVVFTGDAHAATRIVNAEERNPSACAIVNVAFVRGAQIATVRHDDRAFEIVRILVIGIETESGIRQVRPAAYFSLFAIKEYAV